MILVHHSILASIVSLTLLFNFLIYLLVLTPPQTSTPPFYTLTFKPPPLVLQMTPSVPFAAMSNPIKHFDSLDHTYPLEKFVAHLGARVTFQLGSQPLNIQSHLTWHVCLSFTVPSQELPLFSMTASLKFMELIGLLFSKISKNNFNLKSMQITPTLKLFLSLKKTMKMFDTML